MDDLIVNARSYVANASESGADTLILDMADEIERLKIGQAVIAEQVGYYKPETPDFEMVTVPLGILRRALHCFALPYPEDGGA